MTCQSASLPCRSEPRAATRPSSRANWARTHTAPTDRPCFSSGPPSTADARMRPKSPLCLRASRIASTSSGLQSSPDAARRRAPVVRSRRRRHPHRAPPRPVPRSHQPKTPTTPKSEIVSVFYPDPSLPRQRGTSVQGAHAQGDGPPQGRDAETHDRRHQPRAAGLGRLLRLQRGLRTARPRRLDQAAIALHAVGAMEDATTAVPGTQTGGSRRKSRLRRDHEPLTMGEIGQRSMLDLAVLAIGSHHNP